MVTLGATNATVAEAANVAATTTLLVTDNPPAVPPSGGLLSTSPSSVLLSLKTVSLGLPQALRSIVPEGDNIPAQGK